MTLVRLETEFIDITAPPVVATQKQVYRQFSGNTRNAPVQLMLRFRPTHHFRGFQRASYFLFAFDSKGGRVREPPGRVSLCMTPMYMLPSM
jgi:hypothetical protein